VAATNILTIGSSAASAEFTVQPGEQWTICLKGPGGAVPTEASVSIALKDDQGALTEFYVLDGVRKAFVLSASGAYTVTRSETKPALAFGVFRG